MRNADRRDKDPIRPSLRYHRVRLHTIENVLPLLGCLLNLIRRCRVAQGLIDDIEFPLQLFIFLFQRSQLHTGIFIFPKRRDRARHFVRIHLREKIHFHDHDIPIQRRGDLLVEHDHQSGRIGSDFVLGHIHVMDNGDALQVRCHLFERIPLGRLAGKSDRVFAGIAVAHAMLTLGIDDPDVSERRDIGHERREREKKGNGSIRSMSRQEQAKRQLME